MQTLLYDLRFAMRQLRNTLGIAVLAVLTLALGVGANTAIFTVIDSVLLRPLPYANSDRLIFIAPKSDKPSFGANSWLDFSDIRAQSKLLQNVAGYSEGCQRSGRPWTVRISVLRSASNPQPLYDAWWARPSGGAPLLKPRESPLAAPPSSCYRKASGGRAFYADRGILAGP